MGIHANLPPPIFDVEDFLAFTQSRPDEEKWELIDGRLHLSPSANRRHQIIVGNIQVRVFLQGEQSAQAWEIIQGIGVKISPRSLPVPDLLVRP